MRKQPSAFIQQLQAALDRKYGVSVCSFISSSSAGGYLTVDLAGYFATEEGKKVWAKAVEDSKHVPEAPGCIHVGRRRD